MAKKFPWEPDFACYDTCKCGHVYVVHGKNNGPCVESSNGKCPCKRFRFKHHEVMGKYNA